MELSLNDFTRFAVANSNNKIQTLSGIKVGQSADYAPEKDYYKYLRKGITDFEAGKINLSQLQTINLKLSDKRKVSGYQAPLNAFTTWRGQFSGQGIVVEKKKWSSGGLTVKVNPTICIDDDGVKNYIYLNFKKEQISQDRANVMATIMNEVYHRNSDRSYVMNVREQNLLTATNTSNHLLRINMEAAALQAVWSQV